MTPSHAPGCADSISCGSSDTSTSRAVLLAFGLAAAGLTLAGYLGTQAVRGTIRWLHGQPQYQVQFRDIQLREPPPAWFRGSAQAFLRQVREHAKEAEVLPVLDLQPDRIDRDFRLYPWVDDVLRVEYPPEGIRVSLVYKQPVATAPSLPGEFVILDRNGHILPADDIDTDKLGPLMSIDGRGLDQASAENRPGLVWKSSAQGDEGPRLERCVKAAASLAGFLQEPERANAAASVPALRVLTIFATDRRGYFLRNAEGALIHWGEAPGSEAGRKPRGQGKMGPAGKMGGDAVAANFVTPRFLEDHACGARAGEDRSGALEREHPLMRSNSLRDNGATGRPISL